MKRKVSAVGVLAFGFLVMASSIRADNITQTGESMIVAENGETREAVTPVAEVATIKYDVFSEQMTPPMRMEDAVMKELVLSTTQTDEMVREAEVMAETIAETVTTDTLKGASDVEKVQETEVVTNSNPEEETKNVSNETKDASENKSAVDPDELYMLSHLIYAEAGSTKCSDKTRYYVGSVVLNRVNNDWFEEDTIKEVIFADGQYECTWLGTYYNEPTERCVEIARDLLENGSVLPENVVFQAEFKQGDGVYDYVDNIYFCYKNDKK